MGLARAVVLSGRPYSFHLHRRLRIAPAEYNGSATKNVRPKQQQQTATARPHCTAVRWAACLSKPKRECGIMMEGSHGTLLCHTSTSGL